MSNTVMHVGIEEPVQKRKELLNIAVDTIQTLKDFEVHKKISRENAVYRKHFIQAIKEINQAIHDFKERIPAMHIPHPKEEKKEGPKEKAPKIAIIKKPVKRSQTHLDKLEDDISSLKDKIANL